MMKKLLLILIAVGGTVMTTFAQSSTSSSPAANARFSVGIEAGLPISTAGNIYSFAIGGSLKYELPIASNTLFGVSAGYTSITAKSLYGGGSDAFAPLKVGAKYYVSDGLYAEGQVGVTFYVGSGNSVTYFAYSPGVGYTLCKNFDVGIRYEGWVKNGTLSQVGLRAAYLFQ
jgi:hypothetical protein